MTRYTKIESLLSDGEFHLNVELCNTVGWRFGGALHEIRGKGYVFEKESRHEGDKKYVEYWKIIQTPTTILSPNPSVQCTIPLTS